MYLQQNNTYICTNMYKQYVQTYVHSNNDASRKSNARNKI